MGRFYPKHNLTARIIGKIVGQIGGSIGIALGIIMLLLALLSFNEASDAQAVHDQYCGGIAEALLDWDGNCAQLRDEIAEIQMVGIGLAGGGLFFLILGSVELSSANKKTKAAEVNYIPYAPQPIMQVQPQVTHVPQQVMGQASRPVTGLQDPPMAPVSTAGFCSHCGVVFPSSDVKFCSSCGNQR